MCLSREMVLSACVSYLSFLAKNQLPGDRSPILVVKPLSLIIDKSEEDYLNCPVRALKIYRARTASFRSPLQRSLFISVNPGRNKDLSKLTIARWVAKTIQRAYADGQLGQKRGGGGSFSSNFVTYLVS